MLLSLLPLLLLLLLYWYLLLTNNAQHWVCTLVESEFGLVQFDSRMKNYTQTIHRVHIVCIVKPYGKKWPRLNNKWKIHAGGWTHKSNLLLLKRFLFTVFVLLFVSMKIVIVNFMQFRLCTEWPYVRFVSVYFMMCISPTKSEHTNISVNWGLYFYFSLSLTLCLFSAQYLWQLHQNK